MDIRIAVPTPETLACEWYVFSASTEVGNKGIRLRFDRYYSERRPTRRHRNWTTTAQWSRNPYGRSNIEVPRPVVPQHVIDEALSTLRQSIEIILD